MDSPTISARPDVTVASTSARVTPTPPRTQFKEVLTRSLVRGAEAAVKVLPGSPLMAVAIRGGSGPAPSLGVPMNGTGVRSAGPEGPGAIATGSNAGTAAAGAALGGAAGVPGGEGAGSLEASLQQSQEMNLYYLQVQEQVNAQNRSFTALSNVLKAEHDTVKTAIGNIR
jgi:hypothetical protein